MDNCSPGNLVSMLWLDQQDFGTKKQGTIRAMSIFQNASPAAVWTVAHVAGRSGASCGCLAALLNAFAYLVEDADGFTTEAPHIKEQGAFSLRI